MTSGEGGGADGRAGAREGAGDGPGAPASAAAPTLSALVVAPDGRWGSAVRSLRAQRPAPVDVTVVTAGGGPLGGWAGAKGVRVVRCAPGGVAEASRAAARAAGGRYVAVLRGRDEALPGCLARLAEAAGAAGGRAAVVHAGALLLRADGLVHGVALPGARFDARAGAYAVRRDLAGLTDRVAGTRVTVPRLLVRRRADDPAWAQRARLAPAVDLARGPRLAHRTHPPPAAPVPRRPPPALVTVVLPVRNGAATLPRQLRALARQRCPHPWELVVVDNGSTDDTRAVVERARPTLPALRVVEAGDRPGEARARNLGVAAARGAFLAFCDADDAAAPGWLAALVAGAAGADVVGGALDVRRLSPAHAAEEQPLPQPEQPVFLPFARGANCGAWREVLAAVGGWDEGYRGGGEDMDLSWRAQLCGFRLGYAPDALMHYRLRPDLAGLARQKWRYGRSGARLYAAYRHAGFARRPLPRVAGTWGRLLVHTPHLARSPRLRRRWVRYAARLGGFLAGSVRRGVPYL